MSTNGQPFLSPPIKLEEQIDGFDGSPVSNDSNHSPYNGDAYQQSQYLNCVDGLPGVVMLECGGGYWEQLKKCQNLVARIFNESLCVMPCLM